MDIFFQVIITILTAALTAKVTLFRFRYERVWERKYLFYENIVTSLHHIIIALKKYDYEVREQDNYEESISKRIDQKYNEGLENIEIAVDTQTLILSKDALEILIRFIKVSKFEENYNVSPTLQAAADDCLKSFIELAKKDLKL